jgi:alanyl-tRNA synthetase
VDEAGFEAKMEEQRRRAEFVGSGEVAVEGVFQAVADRVGATTFLGYQTLEASSEILALIAGGEEVREVVGPAKGLVGVVCRETPFYAEQGGQVGDTGVLTAGPTTLKVTDTKRPVPNLSVHLVEVPAGAVLKTGERVELTVDVERRNAVRRNHSATHLLHWALRLTLGDHVAQKGSLVSADKLRFDFSHFQPLSLDERRKLEDLVNERVRRNLEAVTKEVGIEEAKKEGAIAFFGEKYGEKVRVLRMGESMELCGGTHVSRTGDIGFFKIVEESGVAQGVRRIEAVTGAGAAAYARRLEDELLGAGERLRGGVFDVAGKVDRLLVDLRDRDKEIEKLRAKLASGGGTDLASQATKVGERWMLVADVEVGDPKTLRETVDRLRDKLAPGVVVLAGSEGDKLAIVCAATKEIAGQVHAGKLVGELSQSIGGKGGGRPDLGQGGGARPADLPGTLNAWREKVRDLLARA